MNVDPSGGFLCSKDERVVYMVLIKYFMKRKKERVNLCISKYSRFFSKVLFVLSNFL